MDRSSRVSAVATPPGSQPARRSPAGAAASPSPPTSTSATPTTTGPAKSREIPAGYRQAIADSEIRDLTDAQRQALAEGADRNRVLNAYRGSNSAAERLAMTSSRERGGVLTPEGIYRKAGDDRQRAIEMLRQYGYLL